jgi:hypothetical protein
MAIELPSRTTNRVAQAHAKSGYRRGLTQNDRKNSFARKGGRDSRASGGSVVKSTNGTPSTSTHTATAT